MSLISSASGVCDNQRQPFGGRIKRLIIPAFR